MAVKSATELSDHERITILRAARNTSPSEAAKRYGIPRRWIYDWRKTKKYQDLSAKRSETASTKPTRKAPKRKRNGKGKRRAKVTRVQRTDDQKRLILRVARDTSAAEAAERFNITTSAIYKWRASGLRAARKPSSSAKANRTKRAKTHTASTERQSPIAYPMDPKIGLLAKDISSLRDQLGDVIAENEKLRRVVIDLTLKQHSN